MAATMTPGLVERMLAALHGVGPKEPLEATLKLESPEDLHAVAQALEGWGATTLAVDSGRLSLDCRLPPKRLWDVLGLDGVLEVAERAAGAGSSRGALRWAALGAGVVAAGLFIGWLVAQSASGGFGPKTAGESQAAASSLKAQGPAEGVADTVVSGDTVKLASGEVVRLAGLRAPALGDGERAEEIYGPEAKAALVELAEGHAVRLSYQAGPKEAGEGLMAVATLLDGTDLGAALISRGAARLDVESAGPRQRAAYGVLEAEARLARQGLWGGPVVGNMESKVYHLPGGQFYHRVSPSNRVLFSTEDEALAAGYRSSSR